MTAIGSQSSAAEWHMGDRSDRSKHAKLPRQRRYRRRSGSKVYKQRYYDCAGGVDMDDIDENEEYEDEDMDDE
eukprot:CAMPEP_0174740180 /NCGR_PEP_ID=MMETSP1094-20130205/72908_1 /TAXON_ID=156173 /ORGANISM="Chrysochromulina brevifilum, Strain UTEX LB 985" /LENGTH=72 /DNA_ID=CAMNT_0015943829 /DNA_START=259 /DNA_END=478 /DNA_ORIENTATION=+